MGNDGHTGVQPQPCGMMGTCVFLLRYPQPRMKLRHYTKGWVPAAPPVRLVLGSNTDSDLPSISKIIAREVRAKQCDLPHSARVTSIHHCCHPRHALSIHRCCHRCLVSPIYRCLLTRRALSIHGRRHHRRVFRLHQHWYSTPATTLIDYHCCYCCTISYLLRRG